ncbi:hypothetical protein PNOK_0394600 [Pyrrhoderma noxium]|uniref:Uncharacterized protein n=1 Tax=Pyrrhoderma noxium TaxID=2282107 RepID=A0A286UP49_9AGAM|nr:hypothetical protein PNOK_0394600 [Pyrrhoderma noxium]
MPPKSQKDKVLIPQATISVSLTGIPNQTFSPSRTKGKKRTLSIKTNYEYDLTDPRLPVTQEVVDAMRRRIIELEDALENQQPSKRAKTKAKEEPISFLKPGPSTFPVATSPNVDMKKMDTLVKRFWTNCKIDEIIEPAEFDAIFKNKGLLIQPTPYNKPTSTVTIIEFHSSYDVESVFGKHFKELKGYRYSSGGHFSRYEKGKRIGLVELRVLGLEVSYAKGSKKCTLKFDVEESNPNAIDEFYF